MIRHIVLFNLKPDLEASDRDWLFDQMQGLAKLHSARRLTINKLLDPREAWYKERISPDFAWALTMEFDDEDGLYAYQKDPLHVTVAAEIRKRVTNIKVLDFVNVSSFAGAAKSQ
jgi:stress responsive alpha/beta barrel protein